MKNGIPICLGYFAVSFAFGIQAADINLSPFQAGLLSLMNVTSAGQFAGLAVVEQHIAAVKGKGYLGIHREIHAAEDDAGDDLTAQA